MKKAIILFVIISLSILFINIIKRIGHNVSDEKKKNEIHSFVCQYYNQFTNSHSNRDINTWYLNNSIDFYVQDNYLPSNRPIQNIINSTAEDFSKIRETFINATGKIGVISFQSITFSHTVSDETITEKNLYYVFCYIDYEYLKTKETLILKEIKNNQFKIYRHFAWIVYD